jgi:glycerol-3-phosphate acyltransferase PlsY
MRIILWAIIAYLVGCMPIAQYVARKTAGKPYGPLLETVAGFLKGFLVIALLQPVHSLHQALVVTALVSGDQWPIQNRSNGRLGLAAAGGAMTALTPLAPIIWGFLWGIGFVASGYRVMGRIVALVLFWALLGLVGGWPIGMVAIPVSIMILAKSNDDIGHLRAGREPKHHWHPQA